MKKFLCALAVVPLLASAAGAQPLALSDRQMDGVNAGFSFQEFTRSNTSWTGVRVWEPNGNTIACTACYLLFNNRALSIGSAFGQSPNAPTT